MLSLSSSVSHQGGPRRWINCELCGMVSKESAAVLESIWRRMWIGRMAINWCSGSVGVVWKAPIIHLTASSCTACRVFESCFCCLNHIGEPYVRTGRHITLYASLQLPWSSPFMELPSSFMDLSVPHALVAMILTCLFHMSLWSMKRPRYRTLSEQSIVVCPPSVDGIVIVPGRGPWVSGRARVRL
jgi:hypothetical protein